MSNGQKTLAAALVGIAVLLPLSGVALARPATLPGTGGLYHGGAWRGGWWGWGCGQAGLEAGYWAAGSFGCHRWGVWGIGPSGPTPETQGTSA